jgi:hypothetical protein
LRDELKAGLSAATPEPGKEAVPSVSEVAERIKALKAAHNIEATPQRIRHKHSSAEEPVTSRIRRRTEAMHASDPVIESDAASSLKTALPPESAENSPLDSPGAFQERVILERQRTDDGPSPS